MFKFFSFYRVALLLILNTILVFSNQLHAQEESIVQPELVAKDQPAENLIRVRRRPPGKRGPTPRRGSLPKTSTNVRDASPAKKAPGLRTSPVGRHAANSRNNSPLPRSGSRKRGSPTKPKGSPPKQAKIAQKPAILPPGGRSSIHAPTPTQSNDRYKLLRGIEPNYQTPFTFSTPPESTVGSKKFRLQWRTNGDSNAGMEHILKRHTREYHDGSFKNRQSMFPEGTTHVEIKDMVKEVAVSSSSVKLPNKGLEVDFRQIEGAVAHKGSVLPLVVGYRENKGQNKPLDIVQAYPKGIKHEVDILPPPTRRRRAPRRSISMPRDPLLEVLIERDAMTADLIELWNQRQADLAMEKEQERTQREEEITAEEQRTILRDLVLDFSSEESQSQSISIMWGDNTNYPLSSLMDYTLLKNNNSIMQKNDLSGSPIFIDQPNINALTTYLIKYKDKQNNEGSSATLTVGAEKITNLKATIISDHKIRLNWNPQSGAELGWDPIKVEWAIFRSGEIIDIGKNATSFEDNEIESNQVYIYRVMAFIQENEPWNHQRHAVFYSKPLIVSTEKTEDFEQDSFLFHTYLLSDPVTDLEDLSQNPDAYYTSIEDKDSSSVIVESSITLWEDNTPVEMLNGRIDVRLNSHSLVPFTHFDNVRMLWDYLLVMVEKYLNDNQATICFPDQPIPISLKKKSQGLVEFQIDDQIVTIGEQKCLTAILQGAEQFFTLLNEVSIGKYSSLIGQIKAMQSQVNPLIKSSQAAPLTLQAQAKRIAMNRVLLSWTPSDKDVKTYEVFLGDKSIITLPAYKKFYTHIFQPKEQEGKCIYKIVSYDQNDAVIETKLIEIEIEEAYLQVQKTAPLDIELSWAFPEQNVASIGSYQINRNGSYLGVTDSTSYRETPLAIGKYTYQIKALDHSMHPLSITPIVIEKTASNAVEVHWKFSEEDTANIEYYHISRNGISLGFTFDTIFTQTPSAIGKYIYKIETFDSFMLSLGIEPLIKEIEITQEDLPQKPPVVQAISEALIKRTSANEVLLSWTPNGVVNVKSYEIFMNKKSLAIISAGTEQYTYNIQQTDSGNCIYEIVVCDNEDKKLEPYSIEFELAASYLQVKKITENVLELNWMFLGEDVGSIKFYNVYRNDTPIMQMSESVTTLSDIASLTPGIYTYRVEALDEDGCALGITAVKEVVIVKEKEVSYLQSRVTVSNVELSWNFLEQESTPIHFYHVFRGDTCIGQLAKATTTLTEDVTQLALGEYTYTVEAVDSSRNPIETKQITLTLDGSENTIKTKQIFKRNDD
ncbi:hypothetical protein [Candidatus Rhabdochlamydia sp. T3358]|uniref:hypothetical protein n=1 Tax=Candidatus Rhabdochlamydia sp. T3358 TaxID=2099795 RepID=UPI0010BC42C9|nr:hypothetical protein [Candidatus Rhabdochlamydia sp. T3358]VHO01923.1 Fibronectin type III domain protein [Candidatus Rhabdochlamydia sp. T3358]